MSRLFPALCLAVFACIAPACDDEEPTEPGTTADDSAAEDGERSGSTGEPAGVTTTGEEATEGTAGSSETGEQPGTATIAPPKLDDIDDLGAGA